jgi:hypothetical protein
LETTMVCLVRFQTFSLLIAGSCCLDERKAASLEQNEVQL